MVSIGQELTGNELLDRAIAYHDPQKNLSSFNGSFNVTMETPNKSDRNTEIIINLSKEYFYSKEVRDSVIIEFMVDKDACDIKFNGSNYYSEEIKKDYAIIEDVLLLFLVIKKLERVGDLIKNLGEEIIFYINAEVLKQKQKSNIIL